MFDFLYRLNRRTGLTIFEWLPAQVKSNPEFKTIGKNITLSLSKIHGNSQIMKRIILQRLIIIYTQNGFGISLCNLSRLIKWKMVPARRFQIQDNFQKQLCRLNTTRLESSNLNIFVTLICCQLLSVILWCGPRRPESDAWTLHPLSAMCVRLPQTFWRHCLYNCMYYKLFHACNAWMQMGG